jgi:hypothetical protein
MIKPEDVTIIIPHLGATPAQEYSLDQCLESLKLFEGRVLIVVNGITTCGHTHDIRIAEQGQCKAVNAAAATVNTPWILITNDDMVYPEGWFERLVEPLGQKFIAKKADGLQDLILKPNGIVPVEDVEAVIPLKEVLCISPTLVEPQPGAPTFLTHFCGGAGGDFDLEKFKQYVGELYLTVKPHVKTGFNLPLLMRKDLWDLVGGYDVNYDPWGSNSDSDLEYKIRLAGVQPIQNRACFVYHFSQTSGTFEPQYRSFWEKNFKYFEDKWGFVRTDRRIWEADFEMPDEERIFRPHWEGFYAK